MSEGPTARWIVLQPNNKLTVQELKLKEAPGSVQVDPNNTILKEVVLKPVGRTSD